MKQDQFDREVQREWARGAATGMLRARQAEIDEQVAGLLQEPMIGDERAAALRGLRVENPVGEDQPRTLPHTDHCECGEEWLCSHQHITRMDNKGLPVWETLPADAVYEQVECMACADCFRGF